MRRQFEKRLIGSALLLFALLALSGGRAAAAEVTASITVGGDAVSVSMPGVGDTARVTFTGVVGQRLGVGLSGSSIGGSGCCRFYASVLKPDGSTLLSPALNASGGLELDLPVLPSTGTYTIFVDPIDANTGSVTVTASEDAAGSVTVGGASLLVSPSRIGQNGRIVFSGAASQEIRLTLGGVTIGGSGCCGGYVSVLNPDGSTLQSATLFGTSGKTVDLVALPVTGTYTVFLDPIDANSGSATLSLKIRGDAPFDGADVSSCGTVPIFRAQPVTGATQYQFQVASDAAFSAVVSDSGLQPSTTRSRRLPVRS